MFSPEASLQSTRSSLRNPRRRQRKDSDGPQQQQPRRKRSKVSEDTFTSATDTHINGNGSVLMNGHVGHGTPESSLVIVDMPVREKRPPAKRAPKEDHSLFLTKTDEYSVKRLPSFPPVLARGSIPYKASALPSAGLALALTSEHALLWDYNAPIAPAKVLTLPLPFGLKSTDALPLGAIVRNGPTNDFGIVAVAPSNGRITFFENVDSAEARSLYPQRHQEVEGSVKLYSGETVVDLVDIEHAGYILVLSSGRLAQLTLRDSQGRPNITTTVLTPPHSSGGSFFSFKGLLGGAIRKAVASVKARQSASRGQMEVVTAAKNGVFQFWDLSWSGQQMFKGEVDAQTEMLTAIQQGTPVETRGQQEIQVLDFAIVEQQQTEDALGLMVLVALTGRNLMEYSLLEVDLSGSGVVVSRAIPLRSFHETALPKEPVGTLLLPSPGHTAFVQFPNAIVVASLAEPEESPERQLMSDAGRELLPFQDAIYFRTDAHVKVAGHALEPATRKDKPSSALVFVQDYGILQVGAPAFVARNKHKVTARSRLQQATFYSTVPANILDFSIGSRYSFSADEVQQAAIKISSEIMSSSFEHLEKFPSSMDEQLRTRALALRTLAMNLQQDYPPISFESKWTLMQQAEKLAAASKVWTWYQQRLQAKEAHPETHPEPIVMGDIVKALSDRYKTPIDPEQGEKDPVRQFFLKDLDNLDILIPWGWFYFRMFYMNNSTKERLSIMQRLSEANDVMLIALETGFSFRQEHVEFYGLDPDQFEDGILKPGHGYDELKRIWTSSHNIVNSIRSLVDVGRNMAEECFEQGYNEELAQKIGKDNPRLVRMGCQTHIERFQWALDQGEESKKEMGRALKEEWNNNVRPAHIAGLMDIGLASEGMQLAEQYHDMPTLVSLIWDEANWLEHNKANSQSKMEQAEATVKLNRLKERISRYFEQFNDSYADAFYTKFITEGQCGQLFQEEYLNQPALTRYLRADPSRSRLRWINEICGEGNYDAAADSLFDTAARQETNAWCSKVELSLSKLALMASAEKVSEDTRSSVEETRAEKARHARSEIVADQLEYAKIQDQLYDRLVPIITGALDDESAIQLLMAEFGQGRLNERPANQSLLQQGLQDLIDHRVMEPALMIDVLTLMTYENSIDDTDDVESNEFILALRVLFLRWRDIHRTTRNGLLRLIWKRLCIKDNWEQINNTRNIADASLQEELAHTTLGWTFRQLYKMTDDNQRMQLVWPKKVDEFLGAGCTDGELCIRFASEDLRGPIIKDNLADDAILQDYMTKCRFSEWFDAACRAGKEMYVASRQEEHQALLGEGEEAEDSAGDVEMQE